MSLSKIKMETFIYMFLKDKIKSCWQQPTHSKEIGVKLSKSYI